MKIAVHYFVFFLIVLITGCTSDELDFAPKSDPAATYTFSITPQQQSKITYNLTEITQQASKDSGSGTKDSYTFMLKGKDKNTQAIVVISGRNYNGNDTYLNIAVTLGGSTTFYKDCNQFVSPIEKGSDSFGPFIRLAGSPATCITTTLDSDRTMNLQTFSLSFNPLTFYTQED